MSLQFFYKSFLFCFFLLLLPGQVLSQSVTIDDTLKRIDALFETMTTETPGGVLAVQKEGEVIYHRAFGMADLERSVKNTPNTIFEAGSVSKQFTAAAVLWLVVENKLRLDDEVRDYIPELPDYGNAITVRHLLNHTSGLKDWGSIASLGGWPRTSREYTQDIARDYVFRQRSLNNIPGEEYIYSNSNYTLLVTLVERISRKTLAEFTKEKFFEPLGMKNTGWRDNHKKIIPGRALAYNRSGRSYELVMPFENTYGHAALLTTVEDLLLWNESWISGELRRKGLYDLRVQKGKLKDGREISYAAAVFVNEFCGTTEISHSGATAGYRAWLASYPEKDLSVAYLSNDGSVSPVSIGRRVAELFLGREEDSTPVFATEGLPVPQLQERAGFYRSLSDHRVLELKFAENYLFLGKDRLIGISRDSLFEGETLYVFHGDRLKVDHTSGPIIFQKVEKWNPAEDRRAAYEGTYYGEEAAAGFEVREAEGSLTVFITPAVTEKLSPSFQDAFFAGRNKLYEFVWDDNGTIKGVHVSIPRARKVYFVRQGE